MPTPSMTAKELETEVDQIAHDTETPCVIRCDYPWGTGEEDLRKFGPALPAQAQPRNTR